MRRAYCPWRGRRKKAIAARKYKSRLKIARKRVQRRIALNPRLKKRTARASIRIMRNRLAGGRGKSYSKLSAQEKSSIDRRVRMRKNIVTKLSTRLLPQTRRKEFSRFKSFREAADHINSNFESMLNEGAGLWHNIHKKREEGRPMRKPGSKGAPTKQDFKDASESYTGMSGPAYGRPSGGYTGDKVVHGQKGYKEYMAYAKKRKAELADKKAKKNDSTAQAHGDQLEHGEVITHESYQLSEKALQSLIAKAEKTEMSISSIIEYYIDGVLSHKSEEEGTFEQAGFKRVNEAIAKGKTNADALFELNRHGVPKDATKAELKKIRSTGSPGAKKLAHWKLNMHHNESYSGEPEHIIQQAKRDQENDRSERLKKKKSPANPNVRSNPNMSIKEGGDAKDYIEVKGGKMSKAEVAKLVKSRKKEMTETAGEMGTDALRKRYEMDTPGQTSHSKYEVAVDGVPGKDGIHKPRISTFKESLELSEADKMCSDKCCGADVKSEDCKCAPDCKHCDCNAVSEAVFDAETPKKGIQRTRQHLSFKSSKPKVYKLRQKQDLYKKDDSQADKEKKSESDRRYPEWVYKQDKKKKTSTGTPTRQPTKKDAYKKDGDRADKYGGDNHPITKH